VREPVRFVDLTERLALKLSAVTEYTARVHFGIWHRQIGMPDFRRLTGVFTPLVHVEVAATDLPVDPRAPLEVAGQSRLARTLEPDGSLRHIVREGEHVVRTIGGAEVARARLVNVFTRYDPDPAKRRVRELPRELGLRGVPARVTEVPDTSDLVAAGRAPDFAEDATHAWHYEQTDANHHVTGMEYLRALEAFVADALHGCGHDLRRLRFARASIVYRKPCFRGEAYRRVAWVRGEAPFVLVGGIVKADDPPGAPPAVAVELTVVAQEAEEA
jgi:hypothetical protein